MADKKTMKTLNGYEIVDEKAREDIAKNKEEVNQTIDDLPNHYYPIKKGETSLKGYVKICAYDEKGAAILIPSGPNAYNVARYDSDSALETVTYTSDRFPKGSETSVIDQKAVNFRSLVLYNTQRIMPKTLDLIAENAYPLFTANGKRRICGYSQTAPMLYPFGEFVAGGVPQYEWDLRLKAGPISEEGINKWRDSSNGEGSDAVNWGVLRRLLFTVSGRIRLEVGKALTFKRNQMYVIQCFDEDYKAKKITINGGTKNGEKCELLFVLVGDNVSDTYADSLLLYTTGATISITNLAATASDAYSVSPADGCFLQYFALGQRGEID